MTDGCHRMANGPEKPEWERRFARVTLDRPALEELLAPVFDAPRLHSWTLAEGGKINTSYRVEIDGVARPLLVRLYAQQAEVAAKEQALQRLVESRVPVPRWLHLSETNPITGRPYAVLEWVEGVTLDHVLASQSRDEVRPLLRDAGRLLAEIGRFAFPETGFLAADLSVGEAVTLDGAGYLRIMHVMMDAARVPDRLGTALVSSLVRHVEREAGLLDDPSLARLGPCLVHSDYGPDNLIVKRDRGRHGIAAVIDWEFSFSGTPLIDLGHMLRPPVGNDRALAGAFLAGYEEAGGALPRGWFRAAKLLELLSWLDFLSGEDERPRLHARARAEIERTMTDWAAWNDPVRQ